jgi:hypothetical protein
VAGSDNDVFAAYGRELAGGIGILDGGEQSPRGAGVPSLHAIAALLANELAERLIGPG